MCRAPSLSLDSARSTGSTHHNNGDRLTYDNCVLRGHLRPSAPSPHCVRCLNMYHANGTAPERIRYRHHGRPSPSLLETDTPQPTHSRLTLAVCTMETVQYPNSNDTAIMSDHAPSSPKRPGRRGYLLKMKVSLMMYIAKS